MMYSVVERKIKNPRLEFKNGKLFAVVPQGRAYLAEQLVAKHRDWIARVVLKHEALQQLMTELPFEQRTQAQLESLITQLVQEAESVLQVMPRNISYRLMKRRWGSCSVLGNIVFNKRLAQLPTDLVWYIVFHEMCHLRVHAHDVAFKQLMATQFPDTKQYKDKLKAYTYALYERK